MDSGRKIQRNCQSIIVGFINKWKFQTRQKMLQLPLVVLLQIPLLRQRRGKLVGNGKGRSKGGPQVRECNIAKKLLLIEMLK